MKDYNSNDLEQENEDISVIEALPVDDNTDKIAESEVIANADMTEEELEDMAIDVVADTNVEQDLTDIDDSEVDINSIEINDDTIINEEDIIDVESTDIEAEDDCVNSVDADDSVVEEAGFDNDSNGGGDIDQDELRHMTSEEFDAENEESEGGKKGKKPPMDKKKKIIILASIAAATVLVIVLSILIPILVVNAPKQFISKAEDFQKEVKAGKDYYVIQKDIVVEGDINLVMSVDINDKAITASGTITINNTKEDALIIGTRDGKEYIKGGQINAKKVVFNSIPSANILANITADEVVIQDCAAVQISNGVLASTSMSISNSTAVIDSIAYGQNATGLVVNNSNLAIKGEAVAPINAINSKIDTLGAVGNVTLDQTSEFRSSNMIYADATKDGLGSIVGGKLVLMRDGSGFKLIEGTLEVWVIRDSNTVGEINIDSEVNYITWLATPVSATVNIIGTDVVVHVPAVANATRIKFQIDSMEEAIIVDVNADNEYILTSHLDEVGKHDIKITMMSAVEDSEVVLDSEPLYLTYEHTITLERVSNARVELINNEYILKFNAVKFADTYEITFDNMVYNISSTAAEGEEISHNLSVQDGVKDKLTVGNHLVKIIARNASNAAIISSGSVIADFAPIVGTVAPVNVIAQEIVNNQLNISWEAAENAVRYKIYIQKADGTIVARHINTPATSYTLIVGEDVFVGDKVFVVAVGKDGYTQSISSNIIEVVLPV